jgi:hypothetical protein
MQPAFFEIDPLVVEVARRDFSYLRQGAADAWTDDYRTGSVPRGAGADAPLFPAL